MSLIQAAEAVAIFTQGAGVLSERQALAIAYPCRDVREYGGGDFREVEERGDTTVLSTLTFDIFSPVRGLDGQMRKSKPVWQGAVALVRFNRFVHTSQWDFNDKAAAVAIARSLVEGVGFGPATGGWARFSAHGLHLYRPATKGEIKIARANLKGRAPLPPAIARTGNAFIDERLFDGRTDEAGGGNQLGWDGADQALGAERIRAREDRTDFAPRFARTETRRESRTTKIE